jgi:tetratricopeptide (TPR) repeat protein
MKNPFGTALSALLIAMIIAMPCEAQASAPGSGEPAWLNLERGKRAFESKRFGEALVAFHTAITMRRDSFSAAGAKLAKALDSKEAREAGGSIRKALSAFAEADFISRDYEKIALNAGPSVEVLIVALKKERISDNHRNFIEALQSVLEYKSIESLSDSISTFGYEINALSRFPEAEYWKGKVFFLEGELDLAENQFKRALEQGLSLDIPEDMFSILYAMADLYELKADRVAWERVLQRILDGVTATRDAQAAARVDTALRSAMAKTLREAGFDKFMTLYRVEPSFALDAYADLASFYLETGRADAMINAAIAVNMTLTRAINIMQAKNSDYVWRSLDDFLLKAGANREVQEYLSKNPLHRMMLVLADALYIEGGRVFAGAMWKTLEMQGVEPYAAVAKARIQRPDSAVRRTMP